MRDKVVFVTVEPIGDHRTRRALSAVGGDGNDRHPAAIAVTAATVVTSVRTSGPMPITGTAYKEGMASRAVPRHCGGAPATYPAGGNFSSAAPSSHS